MLQLEGSDEVLNLESTDGTGGAGPVLQFGQNQAGSTLPVAKIRSYLTNGGGAGSRSGNLVFSTSNNGTIADQMTILANGYVGIGTTIPAATLDVSGIIASNGIGSLQSAQTTVSAGSSYYVASGTRITGTYYLNYEAPSRACRATIAAGGEDFGGNATLNVLSYGCFPGIGHISIANFRVMQSAGGVTNYLVVDITDDLNATGTLKVASVGTDVTNTSIAALPGSLTTIGSYGLMMGENSNYVGIGTASPQFTLDVYGNAGIGSRLATGLDGANYFWIQARGTGSDAQRNAIGYSADPTTGLISGVSINTSNVNAITVNSLSNVGIGLSSPTARLQIYGANANLNAVPLFKVTDTNISDYFGIDNGVGANDFRLISDATILNCRRAAILIKCF